MRTESPDVIDYAPIYEQTPKTPRPTLPQPTNMIVHGPDMRRETDRFNTFPSTWPHSHLSPKLMAMTGFYFLGVTDTVRCNFCKVEIGRWEKQDRVISEHLRWSPDCPLIRRRSTDNVPIDVEELQKLLPRPTIDVCGSRVDIRPNTVSEGSFEVFPAPVFRTYQPMPVAYQTQSVQPTSIVLQPPTRSPQHPEYAIETARVRSFKDWPKTMKQRPQELSDAGLFYTTKGDRVKCFSCGGGLCDWDVDDVPWEQHAKWFGNCEYVQLIKGQEYVDEVLQRDAKRQEAKNNANIITPVDVPPIVKPEPVNQTERKECEAKLCKICYTSEYNTTFVPCGHVAACAKCAMSVSQCPICRKPVERVIRLFFS